MDDIDPRVTALQLLLSGSDDATICDLFCKAFPRVLIPMKVGDQLTLMERLSSVEQHMSSILDRADGTSPLGLLSVRSIQDSAQAAKANIAAAEYILGVKTNLRR